MESPLSSLSYFHFPTEIIFGAGSSKSIKNNLPKSGVTNVLFVSDSNVTSFSFFKEMYEALESECNCFTFYKPKMGLRAYLQISC